jgi:hypothetical protein
MYHWSFEALLGRQQVDVLVELAAHEAPAALQVAQQRVRLVLGGDADAADPELTQFESAKSMIRNLPPK